MATSRADWPVYLRVWVLAAAPRLLYLAVAQPAFLIYNWDAASTLLRNGALTLDGVTTCWNASTEPL